VDLRDFDDNGLTIVFSGQPHEIDVYTLSEALTGFADTLVEINHLVDPEFDLDITIEATEAGSFITRLRFRKLAKSPLVTIPGGILIGMLTNYLYDLATYEKPVYRLEGDEFVIVTSEEFIKLPAAVIDHQKKVGESPAVAKSVKRAFEAVEVDEQIDALGLYPLEERAPSEARPLIEIPRAHFTNVIANATRAIEGTRVPFQLEPRRTVTRTIIERTQIVIVKAVLRRSLRKWQFSWQGFDISARITDPTFFDRLEARHIAIAQGDALDVDLSITQLLEEDGELWRNVDFEVIRVYNLVPLPRQSNLDI
jgi:hypothetical protein